MAGAQEEYRDMTCAICGMNHMTSECIQPAGYGCDTVGIEGIILGAPDAYVAAERAIEAIVDCP